MQCTWAAGAFRRKAAIAAVIVCAAAGDGAARRLLWEGLMAPSETHWFAGADALTTVARLRLYARRALDAKGRDARADVHGSLLGTCAQSHSVLRDR